MKTHGNGKFTRKDFKQLGAKVVFENGVLVFHPENISIGDMVYVGHNTILKGYYKNIMNIGEGTWIGQQCFFHSAGGLTIGKNVGIGPGAIIITSAHTGEDIHKPVLHTGINFAPVCIKDNADIGVGSIILPGVTIGKGVIVGAGSVVTRDVPDYSVVVGNPAKLLRKRK